MVDEREQDEDISFDVNEWENKSENNVIEKGRYRFKVINAVPHIAVSGNECVKVTLLVEKKRITDFLIRCDSQGKRTQQTYKFHNFLFALGIRNSNKRFTISKSQLVGKEGMCDVGYKFNENKEPTDNQINGYSPIEEETAPANDVPPENLPIEKEKIKSEVDDL
jgi:hypothetical protein